MAKAAPPSVIRRVESAVRAALLGPCGLPAHGARERVLVAVSGGPDSLSLLHALHRVSRARPSRRPHLQLDLVVAYFDHHLRDRDAVAEERATVAAQASGLGLSFISGEADVRALAKQRHLSLEDAARRCRYAFLGRAAAETGTGLVAVGHTATDQAETVLLRLVRGTGVAGLKGMAWRAPWPLGDGGPVVIRPLLGTERSDTVAYCAALGLSPRHDPMNDDPRYLRNRVRHELVPLLMGLNPAMVRALRGLAESARDAGTLIERLTDEAWHSVAREEEGTVILAGDALRALPIAVRAEILRRAIRLGTSQDLPPERVQVTALERLLAGRGHIAHLPAGSYAEMDGGKLRIRLGSAARPPLTPVLEERCLRMGETAIPGWRVRVEPVAHACITRDQPLVAWLRPELFDQQVTVTGRRPGDRIEPLGMMGTKKVQDLLVDERVPLAQRDALPILRVGERVAWVVGIRIAAWAAARERESAVRVSFEPEHD